MILYIDKTTDEQPEVNEIKNYLLQKGNDSFLNKICSYYDIALDLEQRNEKKLSNSVKKICVELIAESIPIDMAERMALYLKRIKSLSD